MSGRGHPGEFLLGPVVHAAGAKIGFVLRFAGLVAVSKIGRICCQSVQRVDIFNKSSQPPVKTSAGIRFHRRNPDPDGSSGSIKEVCA